MRCPACGTVNNPGRIYCGGCARAIGAACTACSFVNEPVNRYCGGCARDLLASAAPAAPVSAPAPPPGKGARAGFPFDLAELGDLAGGAPGGGEAEPPSGPADATQSDVDSFFQRLAREGVANVYPPTPPGPVPGASRGEPS